MPEFAEALARDRDKTDAVWVIAVPPAVAETVFASATEELKVAVNTPLPFVLPEDGLKPLPVPVARAAAGRPLLGALPLQRQGWDVASAGARAGAVSGLDRRADPTREPARSLGSAPQ